jgi:hypothetical protein
MFLKMSCITWYFVRFQILAKKQSGEDWSQPEITMVPGDTRRVPDWRKTGARLVTEYHWFYFLALLIRGAINVVTVSGKGNTIDPWIKSWGNRLP